MFEGYSLEEITDMIRHTLKDPERRDERENWPEEDQEDS